MLTKLLTLRGHTLWAAESGPEALVLMAKGYKVMEMDDLSADALRVLELNFPEHEGIAEVHALVLK